MVDSVDIVIVGGGLIGVCLLLALQKSGFNSILLDDKALCVRLAPSQDKRALALSPASVLIFKQLAVWDHIVEYCTPIKTIHTSQQGTFGSTVLSEPASLGYVIPTQQLLQQLYQAVVDRNLPVVTGTLTDWEAQTGYITYTSQDKPYQLKPRMIVGADGTHSTLRKLSHLSVTTTQYHQMGIIATVTLKRCHHHQAYERFTKTGAIALLPLSGKHMGLVWTLPTADATTLLRDDEITFLKTLQAQFGYRVGRFMAVTDTVGYPLQSLIMQQPTAWPLVFIGNAAQTLHPIAGQGFNLGLRDVATLADCLLTQGISDKMFNTYQQRRESDRNLTAKLTDGLIRLFGVNLPGCRMMRSLGLLGLDQTPILQQSLIRQAGGLSGFMHAKLRG